MQQHRSFERFGNTNDTHEQQGNAPAERLVNGIGSRLQDLKATVAAAGGRTAESDQPFSQFLLLCKPKRTA